MEKCTGNYDWEWGIGHRELGIGHRELGIGESDVKVSLPDRDLFKKYS